MVIHSNTIMRSLQLLILIFCSSYCYFTLAARLQATTFTKLECSHNAKMCSNMVCNFTQISRFESNISFGCTALTKEMPKILVRVTNYYLKSNKKYKKGLFDVTIDLCGIVDGANDQFLSMFWPHGKTVLGGFLHECPYKQSLAFENITIDGTLIPTFGAKENYKAEILVMNEKSVKIFSLYTYGQLVNEAA